MPFDSWPVTNCTTTTGSGDALAHNIVFIGLLAVVFSLLVMIYIDRAFYFKSRKSVQLIINSIRYFMWGLLGVVALVGIRAVVLYFASPGVGKVPLWFIGVCLVGYIAICMIGYLIVRLKDHISQYESQFKDQEMPAVSYDGRAE